MRLLAVARLSIREAASRRFATVVVVATALGIVATTWIVAKLSAAISPPSAVEGFDTFVTIVLAFSFDAILAIGAAFVAAPAIAANVESGIVLAILPRPLSRAEYVIGTWLGLAALTGLYAVVAAGIELATIRLTTGYAVPHPAQAVFFIAAAAIAVLTVALAFSTRLPVIGSGILAVVFFGISAIDGFAGGLAHAFGNTVAIATTETIALALPSDALWRGAVFALEPTSLVLSQSATATSGAPVNPFVVSAAPTPLFLAWSVLWVGAVLALGAWSFSRRDV